MRRVKIFPVAVASHVPSVVMSQTSLSFTISDAVLRALTPFIAAEPGSDSDEDRRARLAPLRGIHCELGGGHVVLVAMDATRMLTLRLPWEGSGSGGFTIPGSILKHLPEPDLELIDVIKSTVAPALSKGLLVSFDGQSVSISGKWTVSNPAIPGFPKGWRKSVPAKAPNPGTPAFLALHSMEDFCKAGQCLNRVGEIQFFQNGESPVLVFYPHSPELFGVAMPRRHTVAAPVEGKPDPMPRADFAIPPWLEDSPD